LFNFIVGGGRQAGSAQKSVSKRFQNLKFEDDTALSNPE
jgi:hypothetical protein